MKNLFLLLAAAAAMAAPWKRTVCASGCNYSNLQTALDAAKTYQDTVSCTTAVVELRAGETFTGNFVLPAKTCARNVHIRSSRLGDLPGGQRVSPSQTASMAKLIAPNNSINSTVKSADASGTGYWVMEGLEISSPAVNSIIQYTLVGLSEAYTGENQPTLTPHHILIDRSYLHGLDGVDGPIRCIGAHGRNLVITNNYIDNCKYTGGDSQGIWMQNTPGPVDIINNFVEGAGENIMVGGAAPGSIAWVADRNIRVIGNYIYKRRAWKYGAGSVAPTWACTHGEQYKNNASGQAYVCSSGTWRTAASAVNYWVKNLFELKEGQNVLLHGNILDGNWWDKQTGSNILINQTDARQYNVRNFNMKENWVKTGQGAFGTGYFGNSTAVFSGQILIRHNLWTDLGGTLSGMNGNIGPGTFVLQTNYRNRDYEFTHNTVVPPLNDTYYIKNLTKSTEFDGGIHGTFAFRDNAVIPGQFVFNRDNYPNNGWCSWRTVMQTPALLDLRRNLILNEASNYSQNSNPLCPPYADFPANNVYNSSLPTVFENPSANNWRIKSTFTAGKGAASDGTDLGADFDRIEWATQQVTTGVYNPYLHSGFRSIRVTASGASVQFTAPTSAGACAIAVSTSLTFGTLAGSNTQQRSGRQGSAVLSGLNAATGYWVRLTCGANRFYEEFRTSPV